MGVGVGDAAIGLGHELLRFREALALDGGLFDQGEVVHCCSSVARVPVAWRGSICVTVATAINVPSVYRDRQPKTLRSCQMASFVYNTTLTKTYQGTFDWDAGTTKVALLTSSYTADKDAHDFFDDVSANEVSGTGYTAGGNTVVPTVTQDNVNDEVDIVLPGTSWASSTITARYAVYYRDTGVGSTSELIALIDFGSDVVTSNGTFTLAQSTYTVSNASV